MTKIPKLCYLFLALSFLASIGPLRGQPERIRLDIPLAVTGAGSTSTLSFFTTADTALVRATYRAGDGTVLAMQELGLDNLNASGEMVFTGVEALQSGAVVSSVAPLRSGHFEIEILFSDAPVGVSAELQLHLNGRDHRVGIVPQPPCATPAFNVRHTFLPALCDSGGGAVCLVSTGAAFSNPNDESVQCDWNLYATEQGNSIGSGSFVIPPSGQHQFYPLLPGNLPPYSEELEEGFLGAFRGSCTAPVHSVSLLQFFPEGNVIANSTICVE